MRTMTGKDNRVVDLIRCSQQKSDDCSFKCDGKLHIRWIISHDELMRNFNKKISCHYKLKLDMTTSTTLTL